MADVDEEERKPTGCGGLMVLYNVFRRRAPPGPRRTASASTLPTADPNLTPSYSKRRRSDADDTTLIVPTNPLQLKPLAPCPLQLKPLAPNGYYRAPIAGKQPTKPGQHQARINGISAELDSMIYDHQHTKGSSTLVRASSGNVMVFSHLGNIRAPGAVTPNRNVLDYLPKTANEMASDANAKQGRTRGMKALTGKETKNSTAEAEPTAVICRALSRRLDPEELKEMGNEEYKNGRFAEAVALYDRAILIDPDKASYWSNKAAALIGLGQLLEAVGECREAVRIDPNYHRAHHRLATMYLRLGEPDKALHHYKLSRNEASAKDISRAQRLQTCLSKCNESRKLKDWNTMLKETESAVSDGADSAPQVFASKVEALLVLCRHEEAESAFSGAPKFDIDASTKFFGAISNAYFLAVQAQVDMSAGRFEDAVSMSQRAARLDPSSREVSTVARKARAVASARSRGNDLFKASKFEEACFAYTEGLEHDSHNAILLCNRAACRTKLGQWEKAIEDCNTALRMRPSYNKALLRRADCNAKLRRWEASVQDYEALAREMPGDEEVSKALFQAKLQLKKQQGDGSNLVHITTKDQFKHVVTSPGLSVALFFYKSSEVSERIMPSMEQLCKQYPSVNFLKVDMEEVPYLAKSETMSSVPSFKIYKNGSSVKDIEGSDHDQLESSIKIFST